MLYDKRPYDKQLYDIFILVTKYFCMIIAEC